MTSLQMQEQFIKIHLVSVLCSILTLYVLIVQGNMGILGFILGFMVRFLIEILWELVYLFLYFPNEAKHLPGFREVTSGLLAMAKFSFIVVIGNTILKIFFETVAFYFFHAPNAERNIALWMSLYQLNSQGRI